MKKNKIKFLKSTTDFYHNISQWNYSTNPILYVMGLSGSGKTTLISSLKKTYNVCCISLDALRFYNSSSKESKAIVDGFARIYPEITQYIICEWNTSKNFLKKEKTFTHYVRLFNDYLFEYAFENKTTIIVEGIQPFVRLPMKTLVHKPRIIKGTSSIQSFLNALRRDNPKSFRNIIWRFIRYSVVQFFRLNIYLLYWQHEEKNHQKRQSTR